MEKSKIIVILGPTASGKSDIAVKLAKKFNGEVISADSRQVYKGLDIGTAKITKKEMRGIRHHLLDVALPKNRFSVAEYKMLGDEAITDILTRGKLPIICGGTGHYIEAVLGEINIPEVKPNKTLRKHLSKKSTPELLKILNKLDSKRAKDIDKNNARRLIRAIEVAKALGKIPKVEIRDKKYEVLKLGIRIEDKELKKRITKRLEQRLKKGMVREAIKLHKNGLSYNRMRELGLEYGGLADYLEGKIDKIKLFDRLNLETWHYVKRQRTWFRRDREIVWIEPKIVRIIQRSKSFLNT